jgi:hypothetical protein
VLEQSDIATAADPFVEGVAVASCELRTEDMPLSRLTGRQWLLCERLDVLNTILVSEPGHIMYLILEHSIRLSGRTRPV